VREAVRASRVCDGDTSTRLRQLREARLVGASKHRQPFSRFDVTRDAAVRKLQRKRRRVANDRRPCANHWFGDDAAQYVQRPGAEPTRVYRDSIETGVAERDVNGRARTWLEPRIDGVGRDLDAGQVAVIANSEISLDAYRPQRALRTLDLLQTIDGHRSTVRNSR
jgi:hypothetical protein